MRFIYVLAGWEGSAADSRVLRDAITHPTGLKIAREWKSGNNTLQNHEEFFNMKRASARNLPMEDDGSKGVRRQRVKRDEKVSRRVWSTAEEEALLECLGRFYVRDESLINGFRTEDKVFENFVKWCEEFGKDMATGEHGVDPIVAPRNTGNTSRNEHSETVHVSPEYYVPTPDPSSYGDDSEFLNSFASARLTSIVLIQSDVTYAKLGDIAKQFGLEAEESKSREQVWSVVDSIPDLTLEEKCVVSKKLVNNKPDLDLFLSMSTAGKEIFIKMLATGKV
ncbi:UNVERIFIED_CONTAM: hypothetical protein Sradi_3641000 [Sesamum radiatum]|uniref:Uncharacterized protein n=1 Tax=Sesamum radiatum TaxID=300843 RepID=A0AAW2QIM0_SESRA